MAICSSTAFVFLVSHLLQLPSAEARGGESCPSSFKCGQLGTLGYPFTTAIRPNCGLFAINCTETAIAMGLTQQDIWFDILDFFPNTKSFLLGDPELWCASNCKCDYFDEVLPLISLSSINIRIMSYEVLWRCPRNLVRDDGNGSHRIVRYCGDQGIYRNENQEVLPPNCSRFDYPSSLIVELSAQCSQCVDEAGQCEDLKNGGFHCIKGKASSFADVVTCTRSLHCMKILSGTLLGLTICMGTLLLLSCYGLHSLARRQRQIKHRAEFLKRIGHQLLKQQTTSTKEAVERTRVFTATELEKATNYFNSSRIIGQGGQGTVYKGMLPDGRVVAVKKSMKVDESQLEQFINEVVILSQINHRNVVKLLGCCLEREVPLLVYEFISNRTLSQHIHDPNKDFPITWRTRLRIATESAAAIAYLHSCSSVPIYHRDIKSSNILLDEQYTAKVSDFGISRTIMIDQTHLTTCVQGTFGYLDPEYFRSNQFTEKSDVYSFGVVLAELLTSKKPVSPPDQSGGWRNLAMEFLLHMNNSTLSEIVDARVLEEAKAEDLLAVANLAMRCLNSNGKQRPTMREVASTLEGIRYPTQSSTTEQNHRGGDDVMMEMSSICNDYTSSCSFFRSENGIGNSYSVEIQPLKHNTM